MQVWESVCMGVRLRYIPYERNGYFYHIYEQKRHISGNTWIKWVVNGLLKAGFTPGQIDGMREQLAAQYYNKAFYRPVRSVVQEQCDLRS